MFNTNLINRLGKEFKGKTAQSWESVSPREFLDRRTQASGGQAIFSEASCLKDNDRWVIVTHLEAK